jgi:hypothetical protein
MENSSLHLRNSYDRQTGINNDRKSNEYKCGQSFCNIIFKNISWKFLHLAQTSLLEGHKHISPNNIEKWV